MLNADRNVVSTAPSIDHLWSRGRFFLPRLRLHRPRSLLCSSGERMRMGTGPRGAVLATRESMVSLQRLPKLGQQLKPRKNAWVKASTTRLSISLGMECNRWSIIGENTILAFSETIVSAIAVVSVIHTWNPLALSAYGAKTTSRRRND